MMTAFALFRLPYASQFVAVVQDEGEPQQLSSCAELSSRQGFVVAPFAPSAINPILLIHPDQVLTIPLDADQARWEGLETRLGMVATVAGSNRQNCSETEQGSREDYRLDFLNFHAHLTTGEFQKLVLSRRVSLPRPATSPLELFRKACERYPRMMVSLVYTQQSGMWLTATPETLLSGSQGQWLTVALAGTMPYSDHIVWSDKNLQEQRYVATYVIEQLEQFTDSFTEQGPRTVRAGHLAHLRSDFHFTLYNNTRVGALLQALHPTPAVCGLPKQQAFRFILDNEHHHRRYYSGFMGPLLLEGQTALYVTLRCMRFLADSVQLYAGGGLLRDSVEQQEWLETEAKLDTMRQLLC